MKTVVNDINVNYQCVDKGSDSICLLLHGWGCQASYYQSLLDTMSKKYSILALDLPGFGGTDEPKEAFSVDDYADFVIAFVDKVRADIGLDFKEIILIGHSMGGRIIIKLLTEKTLKFPVKQIIMIDAAGIKPVKSKKAKFRGRIFKIGKGILSFKPISKLFPESLENWRKKFGSADYNNATPIMRQTLVKLVNEDQKDKLQFIKASALLIWGENDTATPLSDGQTMEKLIPDAGLVTLKNAGHFSFIEQQFTVNRVVESFLKIS